MGLLANRALGDQIVEVLRERIVAGSIPTHVAIRQDALAQELGVSKIPLREAFARLEQDGLIVSERNRGYFVSPLSSEEAVDVFALRLKIEPDAVAAAALRATAADHAVARDALRALDEALLGRGDRGPSVASLNRAFHIALIRPAGLPITLQTVERLQVIAERYVFKHLEPTERPARAASEHEALLAAWTAGRAAEAHDATAAHIARTLEDLRAQLALPSAEPAAPARP
jgi:DNA-binding GntR family transcriptional regulator